MFDAVWPLGWSLLGFVLAATLIGVLGPRLTHVADQIADRTGWGEAVTGAILLGAVTSLPGIVTTVTAAWSGQPSFAVSHALGGIAVQTVFLVVADFTLPRRNLEHAAPSVPNMMQGALLIALLALMLLAVTGPAFTVAGVHPVSLLMLVGYVYGMRKAYQAFKHPMWRPERTSATVLDQADPLSDGSSLSSLAMQMAALGVLVAGAGWMVARAGMSVVAETGLSATIVGGLIATLITSLPELVTTVAAVRQRALTLAVSGIIGGNAFDVLFAAIGDVAYRGGSIYHAISPREVFLIAMTLLMVSVLLMGLLERERKGLGNIGFEGVLILLIYAGGFAVIAWGG